MREGGKVLEEAGAGRAVSWRGKEVEPRGEKRHRKLSVCTEAAERAAMQGWTVGWWRAPSPFGASRLVKAPGALPIISEGLSPLPVSVASTLILTVPILFLACFAAPL